ncbi:hypothetical protein [Acinetobacter dispersus]|uniref:Uncharacterized protein n=1 Tax=Acinetobacter dispersus TaxID=70348 RepID=N9MRG3_9GAMM|nr:hypothetical protein [Acinetobacter dispersus]ENW93356.1 hypothetical protein F904_01480 [Acinetobacter dispersus]
MNEYTKLLHGIESNKQELEAELAQVIGETVAKWQAKHQLAVKSLYVDLANTQSLGAPKSYTVVVSADLDYQP